MLQFGYNTGVINAPESVSLAVMVFSVELICSKNWILSLARTDLVSDLVSVMAVWFPSLKGPLHERFEAALTAKSRGHH